MLVWVFVFAVLVGGTLASGSLAPTAAPAAADVIGPASGS